MFRVHGEVCLDTDFSSTQSGKTLSAGFSLLTLN